MDQEDDLQPSVSGGKVIDEHIGQHRNRVNSKVGKKSIWDLRVPTGFPLLLVFRHMCKGGKPLTARALLRFLASKCLAVLP